MSKTEEENKRNMFHLNFQKTVKLYPILNENKLCLQKSPVTLYVEMSHNYECPFKCISAINWAKRK